MHKMDMTQLKIWKYQWQYFETFQLFSNFLNVSSVSLNWWINAKSRSHWSLVWFLQSHIGRISSIFPHVWNHTGFTGLTFLHCAFWNVSSKCQPGLMHCHSGRTVCTFSNVSSNWLPLRVQSNIANNWLHLLYNFSLCFKSHWLHLFDCVFSMSPQIACLSEWEVTLVVFIQLFRCLKVQLVALFLCYAFSNASTNCLPATKVSERHVPQTIWLHLFNFSPCLKSSKSHLTLTFLTVRFQMSLQIGCLWECKVTLVAFI